MSQPMLYLQLSQRLPVRPSEGGVGHLVNDLVDREDGAFAGAIQQELGQAKYIDSWTEKWGISLEVSRQGKCLIGVKLMNLTTLQVFAKVLDSEGCRDPKRGGPAPCCAMIARHDYRQRAVAVVKYKISRGLRAVLFSATGRCFKGNATRSRVIRGKRYRPLTISITNPITPHFAAHVSSKT